MLIRHIFAIAAIALGVLCASPSSPWLQRADRMLELGNAVGAIDQSAYAAHLPLAADERERAAFVRATATVLTHPDRAAVLLGDFIGAYPASPLRPIAQMALGDCYYGAPGQWEKAYGIYSDVARASLPPREGALLAYRSAYCLLQMERLPQASALFGSIAGDRELGDAARFFQAYILYAQGDYPAAIPAMEKVSSPQPPCDMADFYLAQMLYAKGDYGRALASASRVIAMKDVPRDFSLEALRIAGECNFRLGNEAEAQKQLRRYADSVSAPLPSALYILGLFAYESGDYAEAVTLFTPATEGGDAMAQSALLYVGQCRLSDGDFDAAIMAFDKALNMDFDPEVQEAAYYNYAVASLKGGKVPFGNAVAIFESFLRKYPDSRRAPQAQQYIIAEYFNRRDYAAALASIKAMPRPTAQTEEARQRALYMLGAQRLASANVAEAITCLKEAASLSRLNAEVARQASLLLGEAYYADADFSASAATLKRYVDSAPKADANLPLALFDLGYAYVALGEFDKADQAFSRFVSLASGKFDSRILADAYTRLGDCGYARSRFAEAAGHYDRAISLNPAAGDYPMLQKALMEGYSRNYASKVAVLCQLRSDYPSSPLLPRAILELAQSKVQMGDDSGAVAEYRSLVCRFPASVQAREGMLQMALALSNAGKRAEAKDVYKQVVTSYPRSEESAQAVEALKRMCAADGTVDELRSFLASAAGAPAFEASEADELTFEAAEQLFLSDGDASTLKRYIDEYPSGASRPQALAYLLESASDPDEKYRYGCMLAGDYPADSRAPLAFAAKAQAEMDMGKVNLALHTWQQLAQCAATPSLLAQAHLGIARCGVLTQSYDLVAASAPVAKEADALTREERVEAAYLYGVSLAKLGRPSEAAEQWTDAARHPALYHGMAAAVALASQALECDDLDGAEQLARAAADADTPHSYWVAKAFIVLSDVYKAKGDDFKALQYVKSLRDNYPGSEPDIISDINSRLK